ncbi:MAG: HAMP domain-containing histidine kinase [Candidatus Obscuribacter sp.]|nr:HAMP domain-containing histidine kinase [Candidatus Obscuribacter sp.]
MTKRVISLENQREEFVAALTHDLKKNPIIGANRLLDVLIAAGDADIGIPKQELLEKVKGSNHSLLLLIQNMLEVYRYECGDSERRSEHFCMSRIIRLCVEDIREEANTKNIELSFQSDGADMEVTGNKQQEIIRVLQNLLGKRCQIYPTKGHGEVTLSESEEQCRIEVKDDGIGINSDEQKHLFSRFWQGTKGKNICNSSGLGLYICKKIVESHGGAISAQSTPSRGATFRVTLPGRKVKSPCEC